MAFTQTQNLTIKTAQLQIKLKRENFNKQIRKQLLNKKITQLRKTLIIDKIFAQQTIKNLKSAQIHFKSILSQEIRVFQGDNQCHEERQKDEAILKILDIIEKFSQIQLQAISSYSIKKFNKKIDAVIGLLYLIDRWILQQEIKQRSQDQRQKQSQIQLQTDSREPYTFQDCQSLKLIEWTPITSLNKFEFLQQIVLFNLYHKIQQFLDFLDLKQHQQSNHTVKILVSYQLIKWLYFYEKNTINYYLSSNESTYGKTQVNASQFNAKQVFLNSYFDISLRMIKYISLSESVQIFFNPIQNIECLRKTSTSNLQSVASEYITCSPFQYFTGGMSQSGKLLNQLEKQMEHKIQEEQKQVLKISMFRLDFSDTNHKNCQQELLDRSINLAQSTKLLQILRKNFQHYPQNNKKYSKNTAIYELR